MARGGYRTGAGRPKGLKQIQKKSKPRKSKNQSIPADILVDAKAANLTPLDYMLKVINDPSAPADRKDRLAQAAAPFVHPRADSSKGKKEEKQEAAKKAGTGRFGTAAPPATIIPFKK